MVSRAREFVVCVGVLVIKRKVCGSSEESRLPILISGLIAMVCDFELGFDVVDRKCKNS